MYRFKLVSDSKGFSHPEESFLDDFYTFVTGEKLTLGAGHVGASLHGASASETTRLVPPGNPAVDAESDSNCRCTLL